MSLDLVTFTNAMNCLGPFAPGCHLAVAVSGGPDSMVLCHLLRCWQLQGQDQKLTALIVDHGLRPESAEEAQITQQRLQKLGIESVILKWQDPKPTTRIQERARQARYHLLEAWCQQHGIIHLLTAHHADDQWETVVSRLQKNSGSSGLRGILPIRYRPFGRLLRPLLNFTKAEIYAYLVQVGGDYVVDPSNANLKYLRVRLRQDRPVLEQSSFPAVKVNKIRQEASLATDKRHQELVKFCLHHLRIDPLGYLEIQRPAFHALSPELQIEVLRCIHHCMAQTSYPLPRQKATHTLAKILTGTRTTVGGWYIVPKKEKIIFSRENRPADKATPLPQPGLRHNQFLLIDNNPVSEQENHPLASYLIRGLPNASNFVLKFLNPLLE
ncbi:tRNA lysidine(34) synthetase TilS [Candidatus Odyssella thessalonicensis]|uniref:tRNA lysidine(34) synthetase TilS n=1 Tax=Candidatus Odyssella thessalonicensis TaxID=84647 RepID=UPI000695C0E3|nr:tRNA lysidine(34) synthetase TilS [Candidatus Odyssella thessalonicensis]